MPWLQRYVIQGFKLYAAATTFSAIFCLCRKPPDQTLVSLLFQPEHNFTQIVFIHFCILLTAFSFHVIGRLIFGHLLAREWSNSGYIEQINFWIFYRLVFLFGVLDLWSSARPFLWWCWWFVIILYARFMIAVCQKRLNFLQTQDSSDLHSYSKRIYRVNFFLLVTTICSLLVISVSISTLVGDVQQEYLFRTLTGNNPEESEIDLGVGSGPDEKQRLTRFRRLFKNLKFIFKYVLDLLGMDDHEPIVGPRLNKFIEKRLPSHATAAQSMAYNPTVPPMTAAREFDSDNLLVSENLQIYSPHGAPEVNFQQRQEEMNQKIFADTTDILGLIQAILGRVSAWKNDCAKLYC